MGNKLQFGIEQTSWDADGESLRSIREKVFVTEQGVPRELAWNEEDQQAAHFLMTRNTIALGCVRMLPDGRIGRLAVLEQHRGQGLGGQLLQAVTEYAKSRGLRDVYLHAQASATGFYEKFGFIAEGQLFQEANIPHQRMQLVLQYAGYAQPISGVMYPHPFASLVVELATTARRQLRIYSPTLDHEVFDNSELASTLTALVRVSRYSDIRILVSDIQPLVKREHHLLSVARRAPSAVKIQKLGKLRDLPSDSFVIRDGDGTIFRPHDSDRNGFYEPDSRTIAKRWIDKFEELWNISQPDSELRSLGI